MTGGSISKWPVLVEYDQEHLRRIALPLGGIGTGTVSLGGRGDLRDWEVANRPAKGFAPRFSFFALHVRPPRGEAVTRVLEGPIDPCDYEGSAGCRLPNHGLPRFRTCRFLAAYPFGQVLLSDPDVPVEARLQAFNPLVPGDADASGIPVAVLRFVLKNRTGKPLAASVCGNVQNFIGANGPADAPTRNINEYRTTPLHGIFMRSAGVPPQSERFGKLALATLATGGVSHRTAWAKLSWGDTLLDYWDDFSADGRLEERDAGGENMPMASLAVSLALPPRGAREVTFLLAWHFPNRQTWSPLKDAPHYDRIGNHYATQYADAWDVAVRAAAALPQLEAGTLKFVRAFCDSDLPDVVKEAALFNLSTLRSQTCFRAEDGRLFGWEGCHDNAGCCHGSCTHVWNYEHATSLLFGRLACGMREVEFLHATRHDGHMSFRINLPLPRATHHGLAAADGQMGCLVRLYRDWRLSGDDAMLRKLWPKARKALEFCWIAGGWDADRDGVMEGCQHNTMDVEYYGPNPQMGSWYLAALRAAEEMARHVGDEAFAATCRDLFARGSRWMDEHLFNGDYYEHEIRPPRDAGAIARGLRHPTMGVQNLADPELQLGAGCLVDQLAGQCAARACGLGYLLDRDHVRAALRSVLRHNFKPSLAGHFNHMRSFALQDEPGVVMATYPKGRRPKRPFPYHNEVMSGFEYTAAVHMLYEGMVADGLKLIAAVRSRHDGLKRNPFDEAECGHHYARAMASWAAVPALTGFRYSAVSQSMEFAATPEPSRAFWSNGYAWGTFEQKPARKETAVALTVLHGSLTLAKLSLSGAGSVEFSPARTIAADEAAHSQIKCAIATPRRGVRSKAANAG